MPSNIDDLLGPDDDNRTSSDHGKARWKRNSAVLEHQLLLVQPVVASLLGAHSKPAALPNDQRDPQKLPGVSGCASRISVATNAQLVGLASILTLRKPNHRANQSE